ncbi:hypothetical protein [Thalassovita sp.]|uniref:hypothetical protein n=1 Tax=Thalassovita sp. TaxID=1979401 RepID=UPI002B272C43|nr:hypothetical protein [Thalassovita sp.]
MPIEFHTDQDTDFFVIEMNGRITDAEMMERYSSFYQSERWKPGQNALTDASNADFSELTPEGLREFSRYLDALFREHGVSGKKSALYCPGDLQFGVARMYSVFADRSPQTAKVFRDYDEAVAWLRNPLLTD